MRRTPIKLYGIIGFPIEHSLSPFMHNAAFARLKIDAVYLPFSVPKNRLKEAISALKRNGIAGFNITVPFKSESIRYLDGIEPTAKMIGAVNTVVAKNGKLIGYNTDCAGFIRSLKEELHFRPEGKGAFILGAGGAARAVCFGLAEEKAAALYIYDVITAKAKALAGNIRSHFPECGARAVSKRQIARCLKDCRLLVNCTPLGMKGRGPLPIDVRLLHRGLKVYDIVYTPVKTKLVKVARRKGISAVGGVGMLLYQGAEAFRLWTKRRPPLALMKKELLNNLKAG